MNARVALLIFATALTLNAHPHVQSIEVYFSPNGGCTEAVINALSSARQTIRVQAYSFTSAPIAEALVNAHRRGVKVQVILDDSQRSERYSSADFLKNSGITPMIDAQHGIAHNKVMIIDDTATITGSFNFTKAAEERNAENLLIIRDKTVAAKYVKNFQDHFQHALPYTRKFGNAQR